MTTSNQRWLSLTGICDELQIGRDHALWLAKKGFLVVMWGRPAAKYAEARFLSPTEEYANKLRMGEALYGRLNPIPRDFDMTAMLTIREVAQIMGWSLQYARSYVYEKKVPSVKAGTYYLYSIETVRDLLWKRQGRKHSKQRDCFLIEHLIQFFLAHQAEAAKEVPTDAEFASDDELQRKFARLAKLPSPAKEEAMRDLWEKISLAKDVASAL